MMSLALLLRSTLPENMNKANSVKISNLKVGVSRASGRGKAVCRTTSTNEDKYTTSVEYEGRGPSTKVLVTCSCPDHLYRWEVALTHKGGSKIMHSNGERPIKTNPSMRPGCCGHVFKLITELQKLKKI